MYIKWKRRHIINHCYENDNGGGSKGLNNLGEFNIDNEKRVVKKIQSVVLNT